MKIEHNVYFDGQVQSLAIVVNGKTITSVGTVLPGVYDFGFIKTRERITVTSGKLHINGRWFDVGETETVDANKGVRILADAPATYVCHYG